MSTFITQIEDTQRGKTILRVEGSMELEDAILLEKIALDMRSTLNLPVILDFADLDFLDSESAPVIKRLERFHKFEIEGMEIFLQKVVNDTERK